MLSACFFFSHGYDGGEMDDDGGGDGRKGICSAAQDRNLLLSAEIRVEKKIVEERFAVIHEKREEAQKRGNRIFSEAFVSFPFNHNIECDFHSYFFCTAAALENAQFQFIKEAKKNFLRKKIEKTL